VCVRPDLGEPPTMRWLIAACGFILLIAVGLQVAAILIRDPEQPHGRLRDGFPAHATHWAVSEKPIAETPEVAKAAGELLNFDDAVFRIYHRGTQRFDVYAAYWRPGKMSERLVAGHTPDVCWVAAGWTSVSQEPLRSDLAASAGFPACGQYRIFKDPQGSTRRVVFWHKAGDGFVNYDSEGGVPPWWAVFTELADHGLKPRGSQYFVRISSNVPWEDLARDSDFRAMTDALRVMLGVMSL
jgi:hypothetical protein